MDTDKLQLLRQDLQHAEYFSSSVSTLLGSSADQARLRGVFEPGREILAKLPCTALSALVRVFLLGETLSEAEVSSALPLLGLEGALQLDILAPDNGRGFKASNSLSPVRLLQTDWWVMSDLDDGLRNGPASSNHVMGVGGATRSLIAQLPTRPVATALDLGTGCGIIAMFLALTTPARVVATDISDRALMFARANAVLNNCEDRITFRQGSLFEPVIGESFDLIVTNPPFVITPRTDAVQARYEYRDGGLVGDDLMASVVKLGPSHLRPDGLMVCLGNWETTPRASGLERATRWVEEAGERPLATWIIEREYLDPIRYAEVWARDGGALPTTEAFRSLMLAWQQDFFERDVEGVGLGIIRIKRLADDLKVDTPICRSERVFGHISEESGEAFEFAMNAGIAAAGADDQQILDKRWLRNNSVVEVREHVPGEESPRRISLVVERPIARTFTVDPLVAAAVGACDGELSAKQIADALSTLLELDPATCSETLVECVRELTWLGILEPIER